jgi:hypothetical protein
MKRFLKRLIFLGVTSISVCSAKDFIILDSRDAGLFSIYWDVLALVQSYEQGIFQGVKVDFNRTGPYYDARYGDSWWDYYFEPICLGNSEGANIIHKGGDCLYIDPCEIEFRNTREKNHNLIQTYIRIKPHIQAKIDDFIATHFQGDEFIIGVHYRGTNKGEVPRVAWSRYKEEIDKQIISLNGKQYKIFLATEEGPAYDYFCQEFPGQIISTSAQRSVGNGDPAYADLNNHFRYQCGEDAIIDCVLLSKAQVLIRAMSNLSITAGFLNPKVPEIVMNGRVQPPYRDSGRPR